MSKEVASFLKYASVLALAVILLVGILLVGKVSFAYGPTTSGPFSAEVYKTEAVPCGGIINALYLSDQNGTDQTFSARVGASGGGSLTLSVDGRISIVPVTPDQVVRDYNLVVTSPESGPHAVALWANADSCPSPLVQQIEFAIVSPGTNPSDRGK